MAQATLLRRALLGGVLVVVVLAIAGVVLARRALDPERLRPLAEQQLSAVLHMPVRIGQLELHFRPIPALDGRDIVVGSQSSAPPSLSLASLHIVPKISTLFSSAIEVDVLDLRGARLNVLRDTDGRWALPGPTHMTTGAGSRSPASTGRDGAAPAGPPAGGGSETNGAGAAGTSFAVNAVTLSDGTVAVYDVGHAEPAATIDRLEAVLHGTPRAVTFERISGAVGRSTLTGSGTVGVGVTRLSLAWEHLRPEDLPSVLALAGAEAPAGLMVEGDKPVTVEIERKQAGIEVRGTLAASRIVIPPLTITGFTSPFTYTTDVRFAPVAFTAYKGAYSGRAVFAPSATPPTWRVDGTLEHLDLGALLAAATSLGDKLSGTGRVRLNVFGRRDQPAVRGTSGTITASIAHGVIRNFPLLASINRALQVTEGQGQDTAFERADGTFALSTGRATTNDLRLVAGALTVSLSGAIGLEAQTLDLSGAAVLTREKSQELSQISKHVSGAKNDRGEVELPLTIHGTFAAPEFYIDIGQVLAKAATKELKRGINRELNKLFKP